MNKNTVQFLLLVSMYTVEVLENSGLNVIFTLNTSYIWRLHCLFATNIGMQIFSFHFYLVTLPISFL